MDNKFPGKDITIEDLKSKFPLVAKKNKNHRSTFNVSGVGANTALMILSSMKPDEVILAVDQSNVDAVAPLAAVEIR